jgi:hypothetical protein
MNATVPCLAIAIAVVATSAAQTSLPDAYKAQGRLIVTQLPSAPFPHPKRTEGHRYHDEVFSAKDHYSDNTVAIFVPKSFRETGKIDFVVHFHGWRNHVAGALHHYQLIEQLVASSRNAVLVVPQGPYDAPDSFGGKLEDPDGFKHFMDDVMATLRHEPSLTRHDFALGNILLSAHSGGYEVLAAILDHGGLTDHIREVWLFDALYAHTDNFLAWSKNGGRLLDIYTDHGGTKSETEQLMATLKQRETPFLSVAETNLNSAQLSTNHLVFVHTDLAHDDVLDKHHTFQDFLETSCLGKR